MAPQDSIDIQLDIREIKTLLIGWQSLITKNALDIEEAFKAIRELSDTVTRQSMSIEKLEDYIKVQQEALRVNGERLQKLEKLVHRMSYLGPLGSAVIVAAAIKFFVG
jgi:uncharacterized coiled-coil protein SlyX